MKITASMVKELRDETSAGMMDCKKALVEADGDMKKAEKILREKGQATAEKKAGRVTSEGVVTSYIHGNGRIGVLLELNCESDFTAKNEVFQELAKDIAMQIAASSPLYVNEDEIPQDIVESEKDILKKQALKEGKPEKIVDKMVEGRIKKYYKDVCLLNQDFIKNPDITIKELIEEKITQIRENISVRRFTRYEMGEGLEKKQEDFADEVNKQLGK